MRNGLYSGTDVGCTHPPHPPDVLIRHITACYWLVIGMKVRKESGS